MIEALAQSGYLLEARVGETLTERGYSVSLNVPYPDPNTGKSREHDVFAFKRIGGVVVELVIECKNTKSPYAFITRKPSAKIVPEIKYCSLPPSMPGEKKRVQLPEFIGLSEHIHYSKFDRFATQWCTFSLSQKNNVFTWMATHGRADVETNDEITCPFRKLVDVTEHFLRRDKKTLSDLSPSKFPMIFMHFPILLINSDLYEVEAKTQPKLTKSGHVLYQLLLETRDNKFKYQIDVITELSLPDYLDKIEAEITKAKMLIEEKGKEIVSEIILQLKQKEQAQMYKQLQDFQKNGGSLVRRLR